jgi:hypothetical protein
LIRRGFAVMGTQREQKLALFRVLIHLRRNDENFSDFRGIESRQ